MPMTDRDDVSAWPMVEPRQSFRPYGNRVDSRHMARLGWLRSSFARPRRHDEAGAGPALAVVESAGAGWRYGVLRDITAGSATLLWPHAHAVGTAIDLHVTCGQQRLPVRVHIERAARRPAVGRFYDHACRLLDLGDASRALDVRLATLDAAQARATDVTPSPVRWSLRSRLARAARSRITLPLRFRVGGHTIVGVSRDLSATGLSMLTWSPATVGDHLTLEIIAPGQRWIGHVTVARCEGLADGPGEPVFLWGLRFDALDAQRDIGRFRKWIAA